MKRGLLFGFIILFSLYYVTLLIFGRDRLAHRIKIDNHSTYNEYHWTRNIQFASNIDFGASARKEIESIFTYSHNPVEFKLINDSDTLTPYDDKYVYAITGNSILLPYQEIVGTENISEYLSAWYSKYIWCFFMWIKVYDEDGGMS